ncbi:uncharacterized protein LOC144650181 [Oculina patagonica]
MCSLKKTREMLLLSLSHNFISEEEFILLYDASFSKNPTFPHSDYDRFHLDAMDETECFHEFRVRKMDIPRLADALGLPEGLSCHQRTRADQIEGLCMVLRRFAYPCRLSDMIHRFGRAVPEICMIANCFEKWIYDNHHTKLTEWNHQLLNSDNLQVYADAVAGRGAALSNCFGFVDGTVRPICRPGENQKMVYNGHKRVHALKFQSVTLPNGLVAHLYGPVEGKKHDAAMLKDSHLLEEMERDAFSPTGEAMCVYGDPAYPLRIHLQQPFRQVPLTAPMEQFNKSMSSVRSSVEWIFGDIIGSFKFLDFKKNLKIGLSAVGQQYVVGTLLRNALTCLYGNTTATFFNLETPSLEEYFM